MSDRRLVRGRVNIHLATMCLLTRFYHTHTPVAFEGKEQVFEAKVKDSSYVYQAGANLVFIRVAQGSAAVTVDGERRVYIITFTTPSTFNPVFHHNCRRVGS